MNRNANNTAMDTPTRACSNCRNWVLASTECRAFPPTPGPDGAAQWPHTQPTDWCSKFNPLTGTSRTAKVSDETILGVLGRVIAVDGEPYPREELIRDIMGIGLTRTPVMNRIVSLQRRGLLDMGNHPANRSKKGIHVWLTESGQAVADADELQPSAKEAPSHQDRQPKDDQFMQIVAKLAPNYEGRKSLRGIHREMNPMLPMSLTTASRKFAAMVQVGRVIKSDDGFYAAPVALEVE